MLDQRAHSYLYEMLTEFHLIPQLLIMPCFGCAFTLKFDNQSYFLPVYDDEYNSIYLSWLYN